MIDCKFVDSIDDQQDSFFNARINKLDKMTGFRLPVWFTMIDDHVVFAGTIDKEEDSFLTPDPANQFKRLVARFLFDTRW